MKLLITSILLLNIIPAGFSFADNVVIEAIGDAYVWEAQPTANFGTAPVLYIGEDASNYMLETYVDFDLSSIPNGATVDYGYLILWCNNRYGDPPDHDLVCDRPNDTWDENTITWNNKPGYMGDYVYALWPTSGNYVSFDITERVQDWIDGIISNKGMVVHGYHQPGYCYGNFDSREDDTPDRRPRLHVIYTPSVIESSSLGETKAAFK